MSAPEINDLIRQRLEKLEALRTRGVEPFGARFPVTHWAGPLATRLGQASEDELKAFGPVGLAGRVVSMRHHGKTCFAHLMDQSGRIQLYARADALGDDYSGFTVTWLTTGLAIQHFDYDTGDGGVYTLTPKPMLTLMAGKGVSDPVISGLG